jgi:hypothetical protein
MGQYFLGKDSAQKGFFRKKSNFLVAKKNKRVYNNFVALATFIMRRKKWIYFP